jgi:acyl carrier protein
MNPTTPPEQSSEKTGKKEDILFFLKKEVGRLLPIATENLDPNDDLFSVVGLDSLDAAELLLSVEDKYGYYIPDSEVIKMHNLEDLAQEIESYQQKTPKTSEK